MLSQYASNAVLAKARAKYGTGLTQQNLAEMVSLSSVAEVAAYLKGRTHYRAVLAGVQEAGIHRAGLEHLMDRYLLLQLDDLCRFERSVGEHMFECLLRRVEVDRLLCFVRYLNAERPKDFLLTLPAGETEDHIPVALDALIAVIDYSGLLQLLKGTAYYDLFALCRPKKGKKVDYSLLEANLLKYLYAEEQQLLKKHFKGETRKELAFLFAQNAELENLRRIVRHKQYFPTEDQLLPSFLIDAHGYISPNMQDKILQAQDETEILMLLKRTKYRVDLQQPYMFIDDFVLRAKYRSCQTRMRMTTHPAVAMYCYMQLMRMEVDNIINIIEGVRYQMPAAEIARLLVPSPVLEQA